MASVEKAIQHHSYPTQKIDVSMGLNLIVLARYRHLYPKPHTDKSEGHSDLHKFP